MAKAPFSDWMSAGSQGKNWERNIRHVHIEPCERDEDPLGLRAVFIMEDTNFIVGASFLAQRWHNLKKAGFAAPMTRKAIKIIENHIGRTLPDFNAGELATA